MKGTFTAHARDYALGITDNGKEQAAVLFEITEGDEAGERLTWFGYFTEKTAARTIESLRHCGWQGNDLSTITADDLCNDVSIVVDEEEYNGELRTKIQWVNRLGSGLAVKTRMDPTAAASFAARMKGACMAIKPSAPQAATAPKPRPAPQKPAAQAKQNEYPYDDAAPGPEQDPF